jgi:D-alanyl-D-alanine carboxypeptidase (penicillin-binding protein 5/6)
MYLTSRALPRHTPAFCAAIVALVVVATVAQRIAADRDDAGRQYLAHDDWPVHGQAAYQLTGGTIHSSPDQQAVPIASVAKVMTAYVVLADFPLGAHDNGFTLTITAADVADTARRRQLDESVVRVAAGEVLTEREALAALLLPSANNIAVILARIVAGSVHAFTTAMNETARSMGMLHTTYTDPSGFDSTTRSTAADQVRLARAAMKVATIAALVDLPTYRLPVAGVVHNTDTLLGKDGFVGTKTGSMDSSGGCFMFATDRLVDGHRVELFGVVLGQHGHNIVTAALTAAEQLANAVEPNPV